MTRQHILDEIRRSAKENGGVPLGLKRFEQKTGIGYYDWWGNYWSRWLTGVAAGRVLRGEGWQPDSASSYVTGAGESR